MDGIRGVHNRLLGGEREIWNGRGRGSAMGDKRAKSPIGSRKLPPPPFFACISAQYTSIIAADPAAGARADPSPKTCAGA